MNAVWPVFFPAYCVDFPCHTSVWQGKSLCLPGKILFHPASLVMNTGSKQKAGEGVSPLPLIYESGMSRMTPSKFSLRSTGRKSAGFSGGKSRQRSRSSRPVSSWENRFLRIRAGFPPTTAWGSTSPATTEYAAGDGAEFSAVPLKGRGVRGAVVIGAVPHRDAGGGNHIFQKAGRAVFVGKYHVRAGNVVHKNLLVLSVHHLQTELPRRGCGPLFADFPHFMQCKSSLFRRWNLS